MTWGGVAETERLGSTRLERWSGVGWTTLRVRTTPHASIGWVVVGAYTSRAELRQVTSVENRDITIAALTYYHDPDEIVLALDAPTLNVRWFGAKGDGVTDDTAAIQAAIDAATASWSATDWISRHVFIPGGTYAVADLILKQGVVLSGGASEHTGTKLLGIAGADWVVDTGATRIEKAGVENLSIMGPATYADNAMGGLRIQDGARCKIKSVYFNGFANQAIVMGGIANRIQDVFVQNSVQNRTRVVVIGGIEVTGTDHYLLDSEVTVGNSTFTGASDANLYCVAWYISAGTCFISNCIGEISDIGYYFGTLADFGMIVNCRADKNYGHGFYMVNGASRLQFSNCLALNNSSDTDNTYDGFHYAGTSGAEILFNNCFAYSASTVTNKHRYGFYSNESSGTIPSVFNGCRSTGHQTAPVSLNASYGSFFAVQSGGRALTFADKDTTPSVKPGEIPQENFRTANTGATAITTFDDGIDGQRIFVVTFDTNTTFTQGATLKLLTGADTVSTNPGAYMFQLRSGVWYQF